MDSILEMEEPDSIEEIQMGNNIEEFDPVVLDEMLKSYTDRVEHLNNEYKYSSSAEESSEDEF